MKKQTKNDFLVTELSRIIHEEKLRPHQLFLSQNEICERYKVHVHTVRRALEKMEKLGLIYRINRKGTFVSPRQRDRTLVIVMRGQISRTYHDAIDLYLGVQDCTDSVHYNPVVMTHEDFREIRADIGYVYQNLAGVLFFRHASVMLESQNILKRREIPFFFYGSSANAQRLGAIPSLFYDEKKIITLALDHLYERGYREIGFAYRSSWIQAYDERFRLYREWMAAHHLEIPETGILDTPQEELFPFLKKHFVKDGPGCKAILCVDDGYAVKVHQAALHCGLRIPDDIAIVGVNDNPVSAVIEPPLTTVRIPVYRDMLRMSAAISKSLEQADDAWNNLVSEVSLINRGST